ncbi:hypothetical protein [Paenibacillus sp. FSL H7-0714]|uniref:hypothetical protein n=1 Tax=Paenibacillus sp. FSL H7-0714 TaxID=2954735 RepID=UPI0030F6BD16
MSKKARIIFLSMVAILIITIATSFVPTSLTYANESETPSPTISPTPTPIHNETGLLFGKMINYGDYQFNHSGNTDVLTDGNKNTGKLFNGKDPSTAWYIFTEDKDIDAVKVLLSDKQYLAVRFYDLNDKEIIAYNVTGAGDKFNFPYTIRNVRKISFTINNRTAYELDVYGQNSTSPTPGATPTPTPTATPTATPTPETPSGDHAILTITLTTGLVKEFDLPMSKVNSFLAWYDSSSGSIKYGIDKQENNKGPFSKRTEYVVHDKILTFEVSEYTTK